MGEDTWASGPTLRAGRRRMSGLGAGCPAVHGRPDVRAWAGCPAWRWPFFGCFCCPCRISGVMPDVRPLLKRRMSGLVAGCPGWRRMSGGCNFSRSVFFRLLFQASLADGVGDPWRLHSSSPSVKLRQYLCMHTRGVSSSIPSSKGSSEHV